MKTYHAKETEIQKKWHLIDLTDLTVGRVSTKIARILMGKDKATFTPSVDTGDFIVAINADKLKFTGAKWEDKMYYKHTGSMGGIREINAEDLRKKDSTQILIHSVKGMLPKTALGRNMIKKLKVFKDANHTHEAQQPEALAV